MAHGGKRENAGRKSKAEELELPALIEEVVGTEGKKEIIRKLYEKAKSGSFLHSQLLMHYMFGKPQDKLDITSAGQEIKAFTLLIKPDSDDQE